MIAGLILPVSSTLSPKFIRCASRPHFHHCSTPRARAPPSDPATLMIQPVACRGTCCLASGGGRDVTMQPPDAAVPRLMASPSRGTYLPRRGCAARPAPPASKPAPRWPRRNDMGTGCRGLARPQLQPAAGWASAARGSRRAL